MLLCFNNNSFITYIEFQSIVFTSSFLISMYSFQESWFYFNVKDIFPRSIIVKKIFRKESNWFDFTDNWRFTFLHKFYEKYDSKNDVTRKYSWLSDWKHIFPFIWGRMTIAMSTGAKGFMLSDDTSHSRSCKGNLTITRPTHRLSFLALYRSVPQMESVVITIWKSTLEYLSWNSFSSSLNLAKMFLQRYNAYKSKFSSHFPYWLEKTVFLAPQFILKEKIEIYVSLLYPRKVCENILSWKL